jgi:hypothetical protein
MLKNPVSMKEILIGKIHYPFLCQVSLALLLDVSAGNFQRALVYESAMLRNQMGMHSISEMFTMQGPPCAPTSQG